MPTARLILDDAVCGLRRLDDVSVDMVLTDPPYESLEKWRATGTTTRLKHSKKSSNDWFNVFPNDRFDELFSELYRVMKKNSHIYVFSDDESSDSIRLSMIFAGFKYWKRLIWDKVDMGMGYHYRNRHEFVMFGEKGVRKLNSMSVSSIVSAKRVHRGYPAEKPVLIQKLFVSQSTNNGEVVLDPFCGSSSSGEAAISLGRSYIGIDTSAKALEISTGRLERIGCRGV